MASANRHGTVYIPRWQPDSIELITLFVSTGLRNFDRARKAGSDPVTAGWVRYARCDSVQGKRANQSKAGSLRAAKVTHLPRGVRRSTWKPAACNAVTRSGS